MVSLGGVGLNLNALSWLKTSWFWLVFFIVLSLMFILVLKVRRNRRLNTPTLVIVENGNGKVSIYRTESGQFKSTLKFGGLLDFGNELRTYTKENKEIRDVSDEDYHFLDGKPCLICIRKADDPKILVPVSKMRLDELSKKMLFQIAPADYRDSAVDIFEKSTREMKSQTEKIVQWVVFGAFFVIALIVIMLIMQYGTHNIDKASENLKGVEETLKEIARIQASKPSDAP